MDWTEVVLRRDGVRLVCRDSGGAGPAVVMLHGLAGHAGEWDAVARPLAARHRVVAVDQRAHGAAERAPVDCSRAAYVADVVAVLDHVGFDEAVLVGQSLGGHTAMLTAAAHPERVAALVLVEAGAGGPSPDITDDIGGWLESWPTPFPSRAEAAAFFGAGPAAEGWAAGLEERDGGWWPRFDPEAMVRSVAELAERAYWAEWERVTCPTLAVFAQSGFIPGDEVADMLRRRPDTVAVSVPGAGHDVHLERPDVLGGLVADFLAG
ncbi:alpha/beta fold hydrolase [Yinghuangia seranimata]|uniref:alpha/beta fold hydrolase n=1 Tax=Yinghuangia seranimata TaxID=408067 RepID=UPI00248D136A|nr:alpha/beta hydrolase [Yinghuangia seranimata]MDI2124637.1 alpha/beta hydrolase [Yinghuangia seranimata]